MTKIKIIITLWYFLVTIMWKMPYSDWRVTGVSFASRISLDDLVSWERGPPSPCHVFPSEMAGLVKGLWINHHCSFLILVYSTRIAMPWTIPEFLGFFSTSIPLGWQIQNSPETWLVRMSMLNLLFHVPSFYVSWQGCNHQTKSTHVVHCQWKIIPLTSKKLYEISQVQPPLSPPYNSYNTLILNQGSTTISPVFRDFPHSFRLVFQFFTTITLANLRLYWALRCISCQDDRSRNHEMLAGNWLFRCLLPSGKLT